MLKLFSGSKSDSPTAAVKGVHTGNEPGIVATYLGIVFTYLGIVVTYLGTVFTYLGMVFTYLGIVVTYLGIVFTYLGIVVTYHTSPRTKGGGLGMSRPSSSPVGNQLSTRPCLNE